MLGQAAVGRRGPATAHLNKVQLPAEAGMVAVAGAGAAAAVAAVAAVAAAGAGAAGAGAARVVTRRAFIEQVKSNVNKSRKHQNGKVLRDGAAFPYIGGRAHPPLPSAYTGMGEKLIRVCVGARVFLVFSMFAAVLASERQRPDRYIFSRTVYMSREQLQ